MTFDLVAQIAYYSCSTKRQYQYKTNSALVEIVLHQFYRECLSVLTVFINALMTWNEFITSQSRICRTLRCLVFLTALVSSCFYVPSLGNLLKLCYILENKIQCFSNYTDRKNRVAASKVDFSSTLSNKYQRVNYPHGLHMALNT